MGDYPVFARFHWSLVNVGDEHPHYEIPDNDSGTLPASKAAMLRIALQKRLQKAQMEELEREIKARPEFQLPLLDPLLLKNEKTLRCNQVIEQMHGVIQSTLKQELLKENDRIRRMNAAPPAQKNAIKK